MNCPAPLVPNHIELRDFAFLPLDVNRLRNSDLKTQATPPEFRAAVLLWCAAWHQIPAASLPDNDLSLADYAGFGRDLRAWRKVKAGALRGFVLCSDGRLYHQVLAEKAVEAWDGKLRHRHKKECERIKKAAQRAEVKPVYPSFDEWKENLDATGSDRWEMSQGTDERQTEDVPRESHSLKGQGQGEGQGQGYISSSPTSPTHTNGTGGEPTPAARACALMAEAGCAERTNESHPELLAALAAGVTPEVLRDTALEGIKSDKANPFTWACVTARRRAAQASTASTRKQQPYRAQRRDRSSQAGMPVEAAAIAKQLGIGGA